MGFWWKWGDGPPTPPGTPTQTSEASNLFPFRGPLPFLITFLLVAETFLFVKRLLFMIAFVKNKILSNLLF